SFRQPGDPGTIPYPGPSFAETASAILAVDPPKVIGISSGSGGVPDLVAIATATGAFAPPGGVDCDGDGTVDIPAGEALVCRISPSGEGIGAAMVALVDAATRLKVPVDIKPLACPNPLNVTSRGTLPVAILGTIVFDVTKVDSASLLLQGVPL